MLGRQSALDGLGRALPSRLPARLWARPWRVLLAVARVADPQGRAAAEAALVRRAASGDNDAFEALVASRAPRLIAVARKILRDPDAADDAAQRALVSAWRSLPRLRDPGRFDAWLMKLLVNASYEEARRQRRVAHPLGTIPSELVVDDGSESRADRAMLAAAFVRLSPEHRAVVVLRHYADLPLAEVADIVGVPPGTARSRLHYALRSLRAALEAEDRPEIKDVLR